MSHSGRVLNIPDTYFKIWYNFSCKSFNAITLYGEYELVDLIKY